jgi:hypothetical protein
MGFTAATAVTPDGPGSWSAEIVDGWDIGNRANGGYMLAIVARAMAADLDRPDPVTITAHYLAPGPAGPAMVTTSVVRSGRRFATARGTLVVDDRVTLEVLGTFGDLSQPVDAPTLVRVEPPALPPVDECVPLVPIPGQALPPPFMGRVEIRLHPDDARFAEGGGSGIPRIRGWFRLRDGEPIDTLALLCAVDALPPTAFNARLPLGWTPTVELTAHIRARPAPGWLRCAFTTNYVTNGFLEEDGVIWDSADTLVAQSRQLALVPRG